MTTTEKMLTPVNNMLEDTILLYLRYEEGESIADLASNIFYSRNATEYALAKLVARGWVSKEKDSHNKWRLRLTWEGSRQIDGVLARTLVRLKFCRG